MTYFLLNKYYYHIFYFYSIQGISSTCSSKRSKSISSVSITLSWFYRLVTKIEGLKKGEKLRETS